MELFFIRGIKSKIVEVCFIGDYIVIGNIIEWIV